MHTKLINLWDRFQVLFCAEGRDLRECYDILDKEGFQVGKWLSFKGAFYKRPEKDAWIKSQTESKNLRQALSNIQESLSKIAMNIILRLNYQYSQKKFISMEEAREFIHLIGEALALTPQHPKYTTRQNVAVIHDETGISWHTAIQIVYEAVQKIPALKKLLKDKIVNREFVQELEKMTRRVKRGEEILEKSPRLIQGKTTDEKE